MAGISGSCTPGCTADTGLSCCHDRHGVDEDGGDDDEIGSIGKNDDCFSDALASLALMIVSDSQTHFPKY